MGLPLGPLMVNAFVVQYRRPRQVTRVLHLCGWHLKHNARRLNSWSIPFLSNWEPSICQLHHGTCRTRLTSFPVNGDQEMQWSPGDKRIQQTKWHWIITTLQESLRWYIQEVIAKNNAEWCLSSVIYLATVPPGSSDTDLARPSPDFNTQPNCCNRPSVILSPRKFLVIQIPHEHVK